MRQDKSCILTSQPVMMHCLSVLLLKELKSCFLNWLLTLCGGMGGYINPQPWSTFTTVLVIILERLLSLLFLSWAAGHCQKTWCTSVHHQATLQSKCNGSCVVSNQMSGSQDMQKTDSQTDIPCLSVKCCKVLNCRRSITMFFLLFM